MWEFIQELARVWYGSFLFEFSRYLIGAGGVFLFVYVIFRKPLAGRKIRKKHASARQMFREIKASMIAVSVYSVVGFSTYFGVQAGIFEIYRDSGARGWGYFAATTLLMILAQDAYFYWTHRLLHMPVLMKFSHQYHHKSMNPTPWTSYSFDTVESAVHALFVPLYLLFVPMAGLGMFIFMGHMIIRNAIGHSGYELYPRWWAKHPILGHINLVMHHDIHHANGQYNFGLYFTWWDRWMDTEHPEYLARASGDPMAKRVKKNEAVPSSEAA